MINAKAKYGFVMLLMLALALAAGAQQRAAAIDEYAGLTDEQIVQRGMNYASARNYGEAFACFERAARHGYDVAQFNLGQCYRLGHGVKPDSLKAVNYYKLAAMQGQEEAQYNLAECYMQGYGVQRDTLEALQWYRKAAELGVTEAAFKLGLYYAGTANYSQALRYYQQAADKDHPEATYNLAMLYFNGQGLGTPVNRDLAMHWLREAAHGGDTTAQQALKAMGEQ